MKKLFFVFILIFVWDKCLPQVLDVPLKQQKRTQWCWAASAQMVDTFFKRSMANSQCNIVTQYLRDILSNPSLSVTCPPNPYCSGTGSPNLPMDHNSIYKGMSRLLSMIGYYSSLEMGPLVTWDIVINEIESCRPMILFISEEGDPLIPGHVVVVYGYREAGGNRYIKIRDPKICNATSFTEINFGNVSSTSTALRLVAFQMNICLKSEDFCSPCTAERKPMPLTENGERSISLSRVEPVYKIETKLIRSRIDSLKSSNLFHDFELFDLYYPESKKSIGYQIINGKEVEVDVKTANYPESFITKITRKKNTELTFLDKPGTKKYSLVRYPYPNTQVFYSFEERTNFQRIDKYYVSTEDVFNFNKKKLEFKAYNAYTEKEFIRKISDLQQGGFTNDLTSIIF